MRDFAAPLSAIVIAELLGVSSEDHRQFQQWSSELLVPSPGRTPALLQRLREYMRGIVAERRKTLGEDLISGMIEAREERNALSEEELISTSLLLLFAGHEPTTPNLIGNGLLALLRNPDQLERLRREPDLLENAIEELLRHNSPQQTMVRVATEDVAIGSAVIQKEGAVLLVLAAANRDPAVFPERDRLDVARENVRHRHLSFGLDAHFCLGSALVRLEARLAFRGLLGLRRLELTTTPPSFHSNRRLRSLPLRVA